jgi:hypothetical protein
MSGCIVRSWPRTATPPAADHAEQQARFDRFRRGYNHRRPHEALGQTVPAAHYSPSPRRYREQVPDPCYDADHQVARVRSDGAIRWRGELVYLTEALAGELVGIAEFDRDRWLVRFADVELGTIERATPGILRPPAVQLTLLPMHPVYSVTYVSGPYPRTVPTRNRSAYRREMRPTIPCGR